MPVRWVAAVWLLMQLGALAASPLALCCATVQQAKKAVQKDECCQGLAPGQMCPMHHHRKPVNDPHRHQSEARGCTLKNACKAPDVALLSLLGAGVLPAPSTFALDFASVPVPELTESPVAYVPPADTPPPRA